MVMNANAAGNVTSQRSTRLQTGATSRFLSSPEAVLSKRSSRNTNLNLAWVSPATMSLQKICRKYLLSPYRGFFSFGMVVSIPKLMWKKSSEKWRCAMYSFIGKALLFAMLFSVLISATALLVSRISLKRNVWLAGFFSKVLDFFYLPIKYFFYKFSDPRILDKWIVSLKNIANASDFSKTKNRII